MADQASLSDLVQLAKSGDRQAFDLLVEESRGQVEAAVVSLVEPRLRGALALDDIVQEIFVVAFLSIQRFEWRGEGSFIAWLKGIAKHVVQSALRNARHRPSLEILREPPATDPSPSRLLRREERFDRLRAALDALRGDHKTVLTLARIEGLPVREIARKMDRTEEAVRQLLSRALKALRRTFGDTESVHLPDRSLTEGNDGD